MSEDRKKVVISPVVDPADAKQGFDAIKQSGTTSFGAVKDSAASAGVSIDALAAKAKRLPDDLTRAERSVAQSIQRRSSAIIAGGSGTSEYYAQQLSAKGIDAGRLQAQLDYLSALEKTVPKQKAVTDAVAATVPVMKNYEMSAKATSAALRQVPAQFTDIIVSLQGGQNPLTVLLQQGGQLKDVFGGVGAAARAMGSYVLGLVNPLSVAAVTAGTLGYAFYAGRKEAEEFNKAIILSGNFAGTTSGALAVMADSLDNLSGVTQGSAAEALNAFVASGQIGAAQLERFTAVALTLQKETGAAVKDTVAQFVALGKDPVDASVKLNSTLHYLTLEIYNQIKALDDQGRASEAAALAQKAYADALDSRTKSLEGNLGLLERAWRGVKYAAAEAWDEMLKVGRETTTEQQISSLEQRLKNASELANRARARGQNIPTTPVEEGLQTQLDNLRETARLKERAAQATAQEARDVEVRAKFDKSADGRTSSAVKMARELAAAENEYGLAVKRGIISQKEYADLQDSIRKKYTDKGAVTKSGELDKAQAAFDIEKIQQAMEAQTNAYANGEKRLEAARSAGLLSDAEYYAAKQRFIESNTIAQVIALDAEIAREKGRKAIGNSAAERALSEIDREKKVLELNGKRTKVLADAGTAADVLATQEAAAGKKIADGYNEATIAAQNYLDTVQRGYARELAGVGQGDRARAKASGRAQIEDRFESQRNAALSQFRTSGGTSDDKDRYDRKLAELKESLKKEIKEYEQYASDKVAAEGDWTNGATRAIENYVDASTNAAAQIDKVFTSAFKSMEDALVDFAMTGQLDFKKLADGIISDIIRIRIQRDLIAPLANGIGSDLGGGIGNFIGSMLGARASGGPVDAGKPYLVGEKGPELILPTSNGMVIPNHALGGMGGAVNITQNIQIDSRSDQGTIMAAMFQAKEMAKAEILQSRQRGGTFA